MESWATKSSTNISFFYPASTAVYSHLHDVLKGMFSVSPVFCLFMLSFIWYTCAFSFTRTLGSFSRRVACSSLLYAVESSYRLYFFFFPISMISVSDLSCWRLCYSKLNFRKVDFFVYYRTIFAKLMLYSTIKAILYFKEASCLFICSFVCLLGHCAR